ncbi:MAG: hypothetical protein ACOC00_03055 [Halothiobacillaceae bacterium]
MPLQLLRQFFMLSLLRIGPQDLPAGRGPLAIATAFYAVVGLLIVTSVEAGIETDTHPVVEVALELLMLAGFIGLWVWIREVPNRFGQTLTGAYGVNGMLSLIAWPLLMASPATEQVDQVQAGPVEFLILGVMLWNLMALGNVFRHAFNVPLAIGFLLGFVYFLLAGFVITFLL